MTEYIGITAGGTGGHFYPALAIALEMKSRGFHVIMYISGQNKVAFSDLAEQNDLEARTFESNRLKECCLKPWKLFKTVCFLKKHIKEHHLKIMLGMGSFAAFPACLASILNKTPLFLHEGNAIPGKSNRWLSYFAKTIAISLPLKNPCSLHCKNIIQTGLPLRTALLQNIALNQEEKNKIYESYGLSPNKKTLLIFGGSQGALAINNLVKETISLPEIISQKDTLQIIHLTGQTDNQNLIEIYQKAGLTACVKQKEEAINRAYHIADLVLCRSGASTISELSIWNKYAFFIPLPSAADDHQTANAEIASKAGLGKVLVQEQTTPQILSQNLLSWLNGSLIFEKKSSDITLCYSNATQRVADILQNFLTNED